MSIRNITEPNNINLYCNVIDCVKCKSDVIECKDMGCEQMIADNLFTRNDDTTLTRLNTPNQGTLNQVLKSNANGSVYWGDSIGETYSKLSHSNLTYSEVGITTFNDRGLICSKNGNLRNISGEIDVQLQFVDGKSLFSLTYDRPYGESRLSNTRTYGTVIGYTDNNAWLFNGINVYNSDLTELNKIKMTLQPVNRQVWTQGSTLVIRVMYNLNYIV